MVSLVNYKVTDNMPGIIVRRGNDKISLAPFDKIYDKRESIHIKKESNINSGIYINFQEYFDVYFDRLFDKVSNLTTTIAISGTGLLIAVGVALETFKQIESQLVSRSYNKGRKGRRRWKMLF